MLSAFIQIVGAQVIVELTSFNDVRYNSDNEVPAGIQQGILISFVPEFVSHVLNNDNLYTKWYDASGENNEDLSDEAEFTDDEKEAEYRRVLKMSKRGTKENNVDNRKEHEKKFKIRWSVGKQSAFSQTTKCECGSVPQHHNWIKTIVHTLGPQFKVLLVVLVRFQRFLC